MLLDKDNPAIDKLSLCRLCSETLHSFEIAIGVCTDCIQAPPGSRYAVTTKAPLYGTSHFLKKEPGTHK